MKQPLSISMSRERSSSTTRRGNPPWPMLPCRGWRGSRLRSADCVLPIRCEDRSMTYSVAPTTPGCANAATSRPSASGRRSMSSSQNTTTSPSAWSIPRLRWRVSPDTPWR